MIYQFLYEDTDAFLDIDADKEYVENKVKKYLSSTDEPRLYEFVALVEADGIEVREIYPDHVLIFGDKTKTKIKRLAKHLNVSEEKIKSMSGDLFDVDGEIYAVVELSGDIVEDEKLAVFKVGDLKQE